MKTIAAIALPHLLLECVERRIAQPHPPVAVVSGTSPRGIVLDCSESLLRRGVHRGMSLDQMGNQLDCVQIQPVNREIVESTCQNLLELVAKYSPKVERAEADLYFVDLSGTKSLFGRPLELSRRIINEIRDKLHINAIVGIGQDVLIARLAADVAGPRGAFQVFPQSKRAFLGQQRIDQLPGIDPKTKRELESSYGVRQIKDLWLFSLTDLRCLFGKEGENLWRESQGNNGDSAKPKKVEPTLKRAVIVEDDTNDDAVVRRLFSRLLAEVAAEMRDKAVLPTSVKLSVAYRDQRIATSSVTIDHPTAFETSLYRRLIGHLEKALTRRVAVKAIGVAFSDLVPAFLQPALFPSFAKEERVLLASDSVRKRYGSGYLRLGA